MISDSIKVSDSFDPSAGNDPVVDNPEAEAPSSEVTDFGSPKG
jgi:hypothetical protein